MSDNQPGLWSHAGGDSNKLKTDEGKSSTVCKDSPQDNRQCRAEHLTKQPHEVSRVRVKRLPFAGLIDASALHTVHRNTRRLALERGEAPSVRRGLTSSSPGL